MPPIAVEQELSLSSDSEESVVADQEVCLAPEKYPNVLVVYKL